MSAKPNLGKLWASVAEVDEANPQGSYFVRAIGYNATGRGVADFSGALDRDERHVIHFFDQALRLVEQPPNPGLGTLFKAMRKGPTAVIPHRLVRRSEVTGLELNHDAPSSWRLTGESRFLHLAATSGDLIFWVDPQLTDVPELEAYVASYLRA